MRLRPSVAGANATEEDKATLKQIAVRKWMRTADVEDLDNFVTDADNLSMGCWLKIMTINGLKKKYETSLFSKDDRR